MNSPFIFSITDNDRRLRSLFTRTPAVEEKKSSVTVQLFQGSQDISALKLKVAGFCGTRYHHATTEGGPTHQLPFPTSFPGSFNVTEVRKSKDCIKK